MPLTRQGQNSAAGTSVTIPAHAAGDLIIIVAYRDGNATVPTKPTASGTVPAWVDINAPAGANTNSMRTARFVATASNHTSGTWTNATGMAAIVFRGQAAGSGIGASAQTGGTQNGGSTSPAITPQVTTGTSVQLHIHAHRTVTAWGAAPTGFTRVTAVNTELCINSKDSTTTGTGVNQTGTTTSSGFRAETIEILAALPPQGTGTVSGVAGLSAAGQTAKSGTGNVSAVARIAGAGQTARSGSGQVSAVAGLAGEGDVPAPPPPGGGGTITAIASGAGAGRTTKRGTGSLAAVARLIGVGSVPGAPPPTPSTNGQFSVAEPAGRPAGGFPYDNRRHRSRRR